MSLYLTADAGKRLPCLAMTAVTSQLLAQVGFTRFLAVKRIHDHNTTMSAPMLSRTAIPRFLLPQSSWTRASFHRSATQNVFEARRHQSSTAPERCASRPITTALQRHKQSTYSAARVTSIFESRRNFSATAPQFRDHHFDTLKFVQRLKDEGFTDEQAEGMMRVLGDVIEERSECSYSTYRARS